MTIDPTDGPKRREMLWAFTPEDSRERRELLPRRGLPGGAVALIFAAVEDFILAWAVDYGGANRRAVVLQPQFSRRRIDLDNEYGDERRRFEQHQQSVQRNLCSADAKVKRPDKIELRN